MLIIWTIGAHRHVADVDDLDGLACDEVALTIPRRRGGVYRVVTAAKDPRKMLAKVVTAYLAGVDTVEITARAEEDE